jgi:ElaB/YqjD/DUF883 family membrane-anchored ribosome-binding protein
MENVMETGQKVGRAIRNGGDGKPDEWRRLVADVEDRGKKVANVDDEETAGIRSKVEDTLARAKSAAVSIAAAVRGRAEVATEETDE